MPQGNPQLEDGFTRIANELYEAILAAPLTAAELKVMLAIMRLTYGYNRKSDAISYSQIASMTGLQRRTVIRCMQRLKEANVLVHQSRGPGRGHSGVWGIQKHYGQWQLNSDEAVTNRNSDAAVTNTRNSDGAVTRNGDPQVTRNSDGAVTHQRKKEIKDSSCCSRRAGNSKFAAAVHAYEVMSGGTVSPYAAQNLEELAEVVPDAQWFEETVAVSRRQSEPIHDPVKWMWAVWRNCEREGTRPAQRRSHHRARASPDEVYEHPIADIRDGFNLE